MLEWTDVYTFSYPWRVMVEAAYRKYPNPYSSHVHSLDTLERRVSNRSIYSHRLFCAIWSIPTIVLKIVGTNPLIQVNEQSLCDLDHNKLTIYAQNLSLSNLFVLKETLEYSVCENDPSKCILKQTACINVHGVPLIGDMLESLWLSQYKSSVSKGRLGIECVAEKVLQEQHSQPSS